MTADTVFVLQITTGTLAASLCGCLLACWRHHVLRRRRELADRLRAARRVWVAHDRIVDELMAPFGADRLRGGRARSLDHRIDLGMRDDAVEASLPPEPRRRSTST